MSVDISFDKIAHAYDAQRAHPPAVSREVGAAIARVAGEHARVLELGAGTGRIALPTAAAGCTVVGIDISLEMLRVAYQRGLQHDHGLTIQGDITQLPLRDNAFDAVLAVHVLHLIPDWRGALAEAMRVLRSGGAFIQGIDWRDPESCAERLRGKLRETVVELMPNARPPGAGAAIGEELAKLGGVTESEIVAAEWTSHASPAMLLARMAQRADAETWALDDTLLEETVARVRAWAEATWEDLNTEQEIQQRFVLTVIRG
ncbi:MAG: class I SAM-dependent methyltransferase [Chloroflexi bacterium AL-W]|nr:class I SAM-dependent methyltransferase [Chloroflexi bacterium AL-N1]NOK65150.1 class I SAM-dependent methyltransferase [Chloroflexi bacterium AL-N10]NOK72584.1 class I SAM-dependent methyltransferase [Chloroflexi bacterium AL-N5]NOK79329.1 class I SAM-dependent methyltransferase [Chloroflexi bacterium AL-W]NOK87245.1 class I SAM-dependent methyltransferase [Chloroflexi bacterium AL-N15]